MRVLMTTDGSKEAIAAMRTAVRLLTGTDREVHVLCVAPEVPMPKSKNVPASGHEHRLAAETKRILAEAKQVLAEEGVDALTLSATGSPAGTIMQQAEDYDLTVIGAKGRDVRSNVGLGPVASRIVEHAPGCVLVGRELRRDRGLRILVPFDGSQGSQHALDAASSFFELASAEVTLMCVIETPWLPRDEDRGVVEDTEARPGQSDAEEQWVGELRREVETILEGARDRIGRSRPTITTLIAEGNPANEILSEADQGEYDVVVVGASGASDLKHRILGSVSSKIAWSAPCSVLLATARD